MNHRTGRLLAAAALFLGACDHSAPFAGPRAGADGPMPGADPRFLTIDSIAEPSWSADEGAILFRLPRRPPLSPPDPPGWTTVPIGREVSTCQSLLPADGGSALWQRCEWGPEFEGRIGVTHAAAAGPGGRVLFIRRDKPRNFPFPVGARIDLLLVDTLAGSQARVIESLYRDANGQLLNPAGSANWLTDLLFLDATRALAAAWHLRPDGTMQFLGWRVGTLAADTITWQAIPTPLEGAMPVAAGEGQALLWWRPDGTLRLAALDGTVLGDGTAPSGGGTPDLTGIRCRNSACLALTRAPAGPTFDRITAWRIALPAFTADSVGSFLVPAGAPVAPSTSRGSVLSLENRRLVLLRGVVPALP